MLIALYLPLIEIVILFFLILIEYKYFNGMMLRLKKRVVRNIEKYFCCLFVNRRDFICVDECSDLIFLRDRSEDLISGNNLDENLEI